MKPLGREPSSITNVRVPAGDGALMALDVYRCPGPAPTVLLRTPYGRQAHHAEGAGWVRRGYAFVVADVRGRYDSEGGWSPYTDERADGAALVDWVVEQPWSDGRVVAYGGSYAGYTAWAAAVERPALVRAVVALGPSMSLEGTKRDRSGVLRLYEHLAWWLDRADSRTARDGLAARLLADDPDALLHLPVTDIPRRLGAQLPTWTGAVGLGETGAAHLGAGQSVTQDELAQFPGAAYHVAGWFDLLADATIELHRQVGSALPRRPPRRLVVGPWDHSLCFARTTTTGSRDHGSASRFDFAGDCLTWLRSVLAAENTHHAAIGSQARIWTLGDGEQGTWTTGVDWPPPSSPTSYQATVDGALILAANPGPSTAAQPATSRAEPSPRRSFTHDPCAPFPTRRLGEDRSTLDLRADVLRFSLPGQERELVVAGRARVDLDVETEVDDLDWVVRLTERTPEGRLWQLTSGSAHQARAGRQLVRIDLDHVSARLAPGSVLGLEVGGSDFPLLARSLGTGADRYRTDRSAAARQVLHLGTPGLSLHVPVVADR